MSRIRARAPRPTDRKSALVVVGLVAGALFVPQGAAFAVKAAQEVLVSNSADNPVPVEGSVNAVVTGNPDGDPVKTQAVGTENVQIEGTPDVNVANVPRVSVGNTPDVRVADPLPVSVPVLLEGSGSDGTGGFNQTEGTTFFPIAWDIATQIPEGKRFLATHFSVSGRMPLSTCNVIHVFIRDSDGTMTSPASWHPATVNRETRSFVASGEVSVPNARDLGAKIGCKNLEDLTATGSISGSLSGHLVDE